MGADFPVVLAVAAAEFEVVAFVVDGAGAGVVGCCDCINAWGIIMNGWVPDCIIGVPPVPVAPFPPAGGIITGTIIIIWRLLKTKLSWQRKNNKLETISHAAF